MHYRQQLNFTKGGLRQAEVAIGRVNEFLRRSDEAARREGDPANEGTASPGGAATRVAEALVRFEAALDDDLNTSKALSEVFTALREGNRALHAPGGASEAGVWAAAIRRMNTVFGSFEMAPDSETGKRVDEPADLVELIRERREARQRRDFARADEIRDDLAARGILLEDSSSGTIWRRRED